MATVAINGGLNAGLLAAQMLAISDSDLAEKIIAYREENANGVINSNINLTEEL